jgi:hypothetical protein
MNREKSEAKFICIHDCHAFKMDLWCAGSYPQNGILFGKNRGKFFFSFQQRKIMLAPNFYH